MTGSFQSGRPVSATNQYPVMASSPGAVFDVIMSADTAVLASGDVAADTQLVDANAFRSAGGFALLQTLIVDDQDDQGIALDVVFLRASKVLGTENSAPSITDLDSNDIIGIVSVAGTDFIDLGGNRTATLRGLGLMLGALTGSTALYVAVIARGAPTYTANGLRLKVGLLQS